MKYHTILKKKNNKYEEIQKVVNCFIKYYNFIPRNSAIGNKPLTKYLREWCKISQ